MLSIEIMDLVMKLQATYLDIVRPVLKQQPSSQHSPVSNLSLASFEDAVLNNLQIIVDLGLYCGTGHESLTIASLQLLEKMASSRKLAVSPAGFGQRSGRSKIVGILEKDNEAERIGRSLAGLMRFTPEELEAGPAAAGYVVKLRVLDFLNSCLAAVSSRPTIAHILLGFSCGSNTVHIAEDSLWSNGQSLFHAILLLGAEYPDNDGEQFLAWRSTLKTRCWDLLQKLWRSPLTGVVVMGELRENELLELAVAVLEMIEPARPRDPGAVSSSRCTSPSSLSLRPIKGQMSKCEWGEPVLLSTSLTMKCALPLEGGRRSTCSHTDTRLCTVHLLRSSIKTARGKITFFCTKNPALPKISSARRWRAALRARKSAPSQYSGSEGRTSSTKVLFMFSHTS
ncbi:hypothetical protein EON64_13665 [archaeon]|nr:MAG: hypothetical protein EON64_13665 [archaeon]